jgi:hypothetical protein
MVRRWRAVLELVWAMKKARSLTWAFSQERMTGIEPAL